MATASSRHSGGLVTRILNQLGNYDRQAKAAVAFRSDLEISGAADLWQDSLVAVLDATRLSKEPDQLQYVHLDTVSQDAALEQSNSDNEGDDPKTLPGTLFRDWLWRRIGKNFNKTDSTYVLENTLITTGLFKGRWLLIQTYPLPSNTGHKLHFVTNNGAKGDPTAVSVAEPHPRTQNPLSLHEPLTSHQQFVRDFDWASTPVGPMHQWPSQLAETCNLVLTSSEPAAVFWGIEMTSIYNEAFIVIAGQKHPNLMGSSPMVGFAEVWDDFFEPRIVISRATRKPFSEENLCLMLERLGFPEETFVTFTFIPLLDRRGEVVGFYHTVLETTQQVLAQRRMTMLLTLNERTATATDLNSYFNKMMDSIAENQLDVPYGVLYSLREDVDDDTESISSSRGSQGSAATKQCYLERSIGFKDSHPNLPQSFNIIRNTGGFASAFHAVHNTKIPVVLRRSDGSLSSDLMKGLEKRGLTNECNTVIICPLQPTNNDSVLGFLAVGLSNARPYDQAYQLFVDLLTGQIQSSLASVVLFEEEKKSSLTAAAEAASRQQTLLEALQEQARKNELAEMKFKLLTERAPVAMFEFDLNGKLKFFNPAWYTMMQQSPPESSRMSWLDAVHEEDMTSVQDRWEAVYRDRITSSFEFRLNMPWEGVGAIGRESSMKLNHRWVLATVYPVLAEDGTLQEVSGTLTDISSQKWALAMSTQRVDDMIESKRQQENFVDMTSHEMRNPLNAMLLCAQDLYDFLNGLQMTNDGSTHIQGITMETLAGCIDSATTILYCGRHQKRIIDDILTLSKLDARLLEITPLEVDPITIIREALKVFDNELQALDIKMQLIVDESFKTSGIRTLLCDPSRVVQILVNFVANSIKFTQGQPVRNITVVIRVSAQPPSSEGTSLRFVPSGQLYRDPTTQPAWGSGLPAYLQVQVGDTGIGMSKEEMTIMFNRFSQNLPRTHVHYGGSGLGLFISRQLAELQGGEVGIRSEQGKGTTFFFYIKTIVKTSNLNLEERHDQTADLRQYSKRRRTSQLNAALAQTAISTPEMSARKVHTLIVEDNLINQKVLRKNLIKLGYDVQIANHGEEALSIIYESKFWHINNGIGSELDIILMDIEMPVMDGRMCAKRIRELEQLGHITTRLPIVAVTANARQEQLMGAKKFGFDEIVSKPYNMIELIAQVEKILEKSSNT